AKELSVSPVVGQLLVNRGFDVEDLDAARKFTTPKLTDLHEPADLPGAVEAAERIAKALRDREPIVIFGDYDVDGITATSVLWHALTLLAKDLNGDHDGDPQLIRTYIPHRMDEGYGLSTDAVEQLAEDGAKLIITVDCGITAAEQATRCKELGVDLIVTDHHEWHVEDGQPLLPTDAACIVHPRLPGHEPAYGNGDLVGAGVAFKLAWQIGKAVTGRPKVSEAMRRFLVDAMALAALGTVADVAPLLGENRVLVGFGLGAMNKTSLDGLRALIDSAGLADTPLEAYHVGFLLGPRLNACGRMGHAELAVEMLTTAGPGRAREIAAFLEQQNKDRQQTERDIVAGAVEQVRDAGYDADDCPAIVVAGDDW
ncbi:MAG: DHH family phosphoesterase, partial [Planctomycetota bacterium]